MTLPLGSVTTRVWMLLRRIISEASESRALLLMVLGLRVIISLTGMVKNCCR